MATFDGLDRRVTHRVELMGVSEVDIVDGPAVFADSLNAAKTWAEERLEAWTRQHPDDAPCAQIRDVRVEGWVTDFGVTLLEWEYGDDVAVFGYWSAGAGIEWDDQS